MSENEIRRRLKAMIGTTKYHAIPFYGRIHNDNVDFGLDFVATDGVITLMSLCRCVDFIHYICHTSTYNWNCVNEVMVVYTLVPNDKGKFIAKVTNGNDEEIETKEAIFDFPLSEGIKVWVMKYNDIKVILLPSEH